MGVLHMNRRSFACPFCQKRIQGGPLASIHCPFCNKNLRDTNALLLAQFKNNWWLKIPVLLCGFLILLQVLIWAWGSRTFDFVFTLIVLVCLGLYWLFKK